MDSKNRKITLDSVDYKIISQLMDNGRITWSELADILKLSPPSTAERVRRLEEAGIIRGYMASIDPEAVSCSLEALIFVTLDNPDSRASFLRVIHKHPNVLECYHLAGDDDYFLKVRCRGTRELEHLLTEVLKNVKGVVRTRTTIVLSTVKETSRLPIATESLE